MRMRDGRVADAPIALVEAQAYAVEALLGAADLLDALGEDGADTARAEAGALRERVRQAFWVEGGDGPLPRDGARRVGQARRRARLQHGARAGHRRARRRGGRRGRRDA